MVDREMLSAISELLDEKLEQKFDEKLQPVYGRLDSLGASVGNLEEKVGSLESSVGRLEEKVASLESSVGRLEEKVGSLESSVGRLEEKVGSLESSVGNLEEKVASLESSVGRLEERADGVESRLDRLEGDMRYIKVVQLENNVIPRLVTIESCYLDTSRRYMERTEQMDDMVADIAVLKNVVSEHSRKLQNIS